MSSSSQPFREGKHMRSTSLPIKDLVVFAALGAIMFASHLVLIGVPNIGFIGLFISAFTLTYRVRALIPIYIYIMLYGVFFGVLTWIPYLFVWLPLWGMFMLIGRFNLPIKVKVPVYMVLCALHGLSFGTLYAPFSAFLFGIPFKLQTIIAWIIAGLPYDIAHAIGNLAAGIMIVPLSELLKRLDAQVKSNSNTTKLNDVDV